MNPLRIALPAALLLVSSALALPVLAAPGPGVKFPPKLEASSASGAVEMPVAVAPHG
ncbi:hypothetical protein [Phaeovulum sp. W22_SRMD_FR3]|uniref:hypothetical protein n=1 Tax=Phaeovulum sp. W22_SRMD_FR3 TaxID=3240274 RepID=UPI003F9A2D00